MISLASYFLLQGKFAKFKRYTGHSAHVTRVRWTYDDNYLISIGGRDVATIIWKHDRDRTVDIAPTILSRTTVNSVRAGPSATALPVLKKDRGQSDDSDNTDSEEEGYDSDVQHDRQMDYNARILINPVRTKNDKKEINRPTATGNRRPM
jgi:hypothetical protein